MKNIFLIILLMFIVLRSFGAIEPIPKGSFIVNMGVMPQTFSNGLKPYGLVYDLLNTWHIPVKWAIKPNKAKDGIDFTSEGIDYSGGSFIITTPYRTHEVDIMIKKWVALGVVGQTTNSDMNVDVFSTLTYVPRWTLDKTPINTGDAAYSGSIAVTFFENAGIPPSAYGGNTLGTWKLPTDLNACDDIFVLPHSLPTLQTHQNLAAWNSTNKGAIWCACIASSQLENIPGLNFLTTGGMMCPVSSYYPPCTREIHLGDYPSSYFRSSDPLMQFKGTLDGATVGSAESVYLPAMGSYWRPNVSLYITQPSHPNNNGYFSDSTTFVTRAIIGQSTATVVAMGHGFDNTNNGLVMYQGGHCNVNSGRGSEAEYVALQRAFFNFSFLVAANRQQDFNFPTVQIIAAPIMEGDKPYVVTFSVPLGTDISKYKIKWNATSGQILPNTSSKDITYIPSTDIQSKEAVITLSLIDDCGRDGFASAAIIIKDIKIPKLVSPNGDDSGYDYLFIKNIERHPDNEIKIYNRWGNVVYHAKNYNNDTVKFLGLNAQGKEIPDGVYYYVLTINDSSEPVLSASPYTGYFILKR